MKTKLENLQQKNKNIFSALTKCKIEEIGIQFHLPWLTLEQGGTMAAISNKEKENRKENINKSEYN